MKSFLVSLTIFFIGSSVIFYSQTQSAKLNFSTKSKIISNPSSGASPQVNNSSNIGTNLINYMKKVGITPAVNKSITKYFTNAAQKNHKLNMPSFFDKFNNDIKKIIINPEAGTPRLIEFKDQPNQKASLSKSTSDYLSTARNFLLNNKSVLKISNPETELLFSSSQSDALGFTHLKFKQYYQGTEIWSKEIAFHFDAKGSLLSLTGGYEPTPENLSDMIWMTDESDAIQFAINHLTTKSKLVTLPEGLKQILDYSGPTANKIIWYDDKHNPHKAWFVQIKSGLPYDWYYFVDAVTGDILDHYNNVCFDGKTTGSGNDLNGVNRTFGTYQVGNDYFMIDASQPMFNSAQSKIPDEPIGAIVNLDLRNQDLSANSSIYFVGSSNNQWTDPAAVSSHYNAIVTYKYFLNVHQRNSIDDKGMTIYSTVHVTEEGKPMENAFWSSKLMCYGDGGTYFKPLAGSMDVAAHEMTHGVTQYSAGLEYKNQSGALNESMSDVFATLVDTLNWLMGEQIVKDLNTFPTGALRDLQNPHNGGNPGSNSWQPAKMSEYVNTSADNGGVHINSGIPNHAFYLVATNIGRAKAGKIWYRALNFYLTRSSQFIDARIATEKSAVDLYGDGSNELSAIRNAWDAVEVYAGGGTPPPPASILVGTDWILVTNTDTNDPNSIYMVKPTINSNSDFAPLSQTPVYSYPAVSDASGLVLFIDASNNLRALFANAANPQETLIDDSGVWNSVAIGPGLNSLALTSVYIDTTIYYFDLVNNISKAYKITTQSFDAADTKTALYANSLSFDPTGQLLLFDTYNLIKGASGNDIEFWNINLMDIETGYMESVFPPLPEGQNVGNPSFSKTSITRFTFDYVDASRNEAYVLAADFNTGDVGTIAGPQPVIGYPSYSGDDKFIAFHTVQFDNSNIPHEAVQQMPLASGSIQGAGSAIPYVIDATFPNWFVIGERITEVENRHEDLPENFSLFQNYPNPFNPVTNIGFNFPAHLYDKNVKNSAFIKLAVYDILGREISVLFNEIAKPGYYEVEFNGNNLASGIYFYKLTIGGFSLTKKMVLAK